MLPNNTKITVFIVAIILSLQVLNASGIIDNSTWPENFFREDYWSDIFTCKVLDNIWLKEEKKDKSGNIYTEEKGYRVTVQVEKVFFGKVDTGIVHISSRMAMEPGKTYLIYANRNNSQENYFYLLDNLSKQIPTGGNMIWELKTLSELSNIINNKLTCSYTLNDGNDKLVQGFFKNGQGVKKWKYYWPDSGNLKIEYDFTKKTVTYYSENGLKGSKHITSKNKEIDYLYSKNNPNRLIYKNIITKTDYGELLNRFEYYENGKIKAKGEFSDKDNTGVWYFYDEKGKFKEKKIYKDKHTFEHGANNYFAEQAYCSLTGKIIDEENKKVIGAEITLNQEGVQISMDVFWNNMYKLIAYSSGAYEIEVSYLGSSLTKKKIELNTGEHRTFDIQVDLSGLKAQTISGKITDKISKENLAKAFLWIQNEKVDTRIETLKDGTYSMNAIPTGIYSIRIHGIGGYMTEIKDVEIKQGEKIKLDFQLTPLSETGFYGSITGKNTNVVYSGGISLIQNEKEVVKTNSQLDGTFYIEDTIPPGVYDALVWMEDHIPERIKNIKVIPDSTIVLDIQLKSVSNCFDRAPHCQELISYVAKEDLEISEHISGKITNNIGEDVKCACVDLIKNEEIIRRVDTDMNGIYQIEHLQEGIYDIQISHDHHETALIKDVEVRKGENIVKDVVLGKITSDIRYFR